MWARSERGLDFPSLARAWKQEVAAMCLCDSAEGRRWWMRKEFSMASFQVRSEPSLLFLHSTCTECELKRVAVRVWWEKTPLPQVFQEFYYQEIIFLGKEKKSSNHRWLMRPQVYNATSHKTGFCSRFFSCFFQGLKRPLLQLNLFQSYSDWKPSSFLVISRTSQVTQCASTAAVPRKCHLIGLSLSQSISVYFPSACLTVVCLTRPSAEGWEEWELDQVWFSLKENFSLIFVRVSRDTILIVRNVIYTKLSWIGLS